MLNARASAQLCELGNNTVYLAALPIAHNFPLACPGILGTLGVGGTVVMARTPGNDETFALIEREKVTMTALVPPLVKLWLSAREWDKTDISSLQLLQVGGSRFEPELAKQVMPVLGCQLQQVFGMAEGLLCYTRLDDSEDVIINTQGRPLCPDDEIRVVASNGLPVAAGEIGELQTKGPYTLRGYYRAAEHNAKSFSADGFYHSGDLVRITKSGNIVVEGRIKEQINRAGEKIAVSEVEQVLIKHPEIDSCTLIPIVDERLGERSCAFIIPSTLNPSKPLSLQDVQSFLSDKGLPRYKLPDQLEQLVAWPLTAVGKIDKKRLAKLAETDTDSKPKIAAAQYAEYRLPVNAKPIDLALGLAQSGLSSDYALYEHRGEWSLGLGKYSIITADAEQVYLHQGEQQQVFKQENLCDAIAAATAQVAVKDWRAYGTAKFELSHVFHGVNVNDPNINESTLLNLFVPLYEMRIFEGEALLRAIDSSQLEALITIVKQLDLQCLQQTKQVKSESVTADIWNHHQSEYKLNVQKAVQEIQSNLYKKVILSRRIPLPNSVDIMDSYYFGRQKNTPARSFLVRINDTQFAGFSPETVVEVSADGWVSTQPLAGTRSLGNNPQQEQQLREELLGDTKEIAEHAVSVKLAQEEMEKICAPQSISVSEFMNIRRRGSVQHLASRLKGQLREGNHAWNAFEALFPAVTASGIPKKPSIESIYRHEPELRGLYSGCMMIVDSDGALDGALILRSVYRQGEKLWLQAGAGIVDQSKPERELQETIEKLSCISQHLVSRQHDSETASYTSNDQAEIV